MKERTIKRKGLIVLISIAGAIAGFFIVQYILCSNAVKAGYARLETYDHKEIELSYGTMTYVDEGSGEVILSVHGMSGGYDQAFDTVANRVSSNRVIAPSRFGYLGSDVPENPTPKEQAKAFAELLDRLGVDEVYLLATSAGGTVAIRFALDYPERTNGLILYSSAAPLTAKPESYAEYAGPPEFLCSDFGMWLCSPFFGPIMGMESSVIHSMLPVSERREGMILDAKQTNPDMARNFDEYPIESLQVPTLIFHAKDDKMADYALMEQAVPRFPDSTFMAFDTGGHLMSGQGTEIDEALDAFIEGGYSA